MKSLFSSKNYLISKEKTLIFSILKSFSPLFLFLGLFFLQIFPLSAQSMPNLKAYGLDTIAGNSTFLKTSKIDPYQQLNFVVEKPDGLSITIPAVSDFSGIAQTEFYDYHTKKAGSYSVYAYSSAQKFEKQNVTHFSVYPASVSAQHSEVELDKTLLSVKDGDGARMKIVLKDQFDNSIRGHNVKVISSRPSDQITFENDTTNEKGEIFCNIKSDLPGLSSLTVFDLTEDVVLDKRVELAFVDGDNVKSDIGGDFEAFLPVAKAAEAGPLDHFEISDLPSSIAPNQNISFKVKALDKDGQIVENYTGTTHFSAEGENSSGVTLPQDYSFKAEDLGVHQFSLGLSFTKVGTYKILVNDLADKLKKGEKTVVVATSGNSTSSTEDSSSSSSTKPLISSPVAGTYSQNTQNVTGSAKVGTTVKIFDNAVEIGSTVVNSEGKFSFQTSPLDDGNHKIYVVAVDNTTKAILATSDTVEFNIDTTPPKVDELTLDPKTGIKAGSVINIKLYSEPKLSQAAVVFNSDIVELTASLDTEGLYIGSVQAPNTAGVYSLDVLLVDELQNEVSLKNKAQITVDANGGNATVNENQTPDQQTPSTDTPSPSDTKSPPSSETTSSSEPKVKNPPSQVSGLISYGSDKRVTLVWQAATDDKLVKHYRIYYGQSLKNLDKKVDTKDASVTWYIPNLENGKEYFFTVTAVDDEGNESENRSEIVSGIPFMLEIKKGITERPTQPLGSTLRPSAYQGPLPSPGTKRLDDYGPEMLFLIGPSAFLGYLFKPKRKAKK